MRNERLLKNDAAHGLTVSLPNRDKVTMRSTPLNSLTLILSLSKDEAWISAFFSTLPEEENARLQLAMRAVAEGRGVCLFASAKVNRLGPLRYQSHRPLVGHGV